MWLLFLLQAETFLPLIKTARKCCRLFADKFKYVFERQQPQRRDFKGGIIFEMFLILERSGVHLKGIFTVFHTRKREQTTPRI